MGSLLTGADASAAQNSPVTKICSQCGAVLAAGAPACQFCYSSFSVGFSAIEEASEIPALGIIARDTEGEVAEIEGSKSRSTSAKQAMQEAAWRGELAQRLRTYRTRRRNPSASDVQTRFCFEGSLDPSKPEGFTAIEESQAFNEDDFSFTIAIGRSSSATTAEELPMEIDVSSRPEADTSQQIQPLQAEIHSQPGLYPVAPMDDRRLAALIDFFCLLFAYGGFLGLFGSLGGHFTLTKMSAAVCVTTFAIVYLQYFVLFTIFGGTTPGMMMRGLQVVSFSGEPPTPRQMLLRSVGYLISAGTLFLGFLWAVWDSDELTWHDRLSHTYLSVEKTLPDLEVSHAARSR
jgi:uncharacterized RDD family membrane protein YckC